MVVCQAVSAEAADRETDSRPMANRYFGGALGDMYVESTADEPSMKWTMRPERWWSVDYSKLG